MQFIVAAIIPSAAAYIQMNFYGQNGLVSTINWIMLSYTFLPIISLIFGNVWQYYVYFKQIQIKRFISGQSTEPVITQEEANGWWLKSAFSMSSSYSFVLKNLSFTLFFLPIFPLASVYFVAMLFIMYYGQKYILINRSNKLISYSTKLSRHLLKEVEYVLGLFVCGLIFRDNIHNLLNLKDVGIRVIHILLLVLVAVLGIFNVKKFVLDFLPEYAEASMTYDEMAKTDPNSYDLSNPATIKTVGGKDVLGNVANQLYLPLNKVDMFVIDSMKARA